MVILFYKFTNSRSGFLIFWDCFHSSFTSTVSEGCFQLTVTLYKGTEKISETKTLPLVPFGGGSSRHPGDIPHHHVNNYFGNGYHNIGVKQMYPKYVLFLRICLDLFKGLWFSIEKEQYKKWRKGCFPISRYCSKWISSCNYGKVIIVFAKVDKLFGEME